MHKNLLVIGKGQLGSYLRERFSIPEERHWVREMAELDAETLRSLNPDMVVNAAGKTDLQWCEENPHACLRCNVEAPLAVWRAVRSALKPCVPYVHLSTGCVWDGPYREDGKPFEPTDPPSPACFYAWSKAACDALLLQEANAHALVILRPRQVYSPSPSPRNTLGKLRAYPALVEAPNSMTSVETIARTIERIADPTEGPKAYGRMLSVCERGAVSPFEIGMWMSELGLREAPGKISLDELGAFHKPKRVNTVMYDRFFEAWLGPPAVQDEVRRNLMELARRETEQDSSRPLSLGGNNNCCNTCPAPGTQVRREK